MSKLSGQFDFLGVQGIQGKKDPSKTYYNVLLMQDMDVMKIFVNDQKVKLFDGIKKMDKVQCLLDVNFGGEKTYVNVVDCKKIA